MMFVPARTTIPAVEITYGGIEAVSTNLENP
jgi:hypothetical protein